LCPHTIIEEVDLLLVAGNDGVDQSHETACFLICGGANREKPSVAFLKLQVSEKFRTAKQAWNENPANHGTREIPPPPPKKSCMDRARNSIARITAQIRTNHWRSAEYLKRIKIRQDDKCRFCHGTARMSRSHVLLHCPHFAAARRRRGREESRRSVRPSGQP